METESYFNERGATEYLLNHHGIRREPCTLAKLRCVGGGPAFRKINRNVSYARSALDAWAAALAEGRTFHSTAAYRAARAML